MKTIVLFYFILISIHTKSQTKFLDYYHCKYRANTACNQLNYKLATKILDTSFTLKDYIPVDDLKLASMVAIRSGDTVKGINLFRLALCQGIDTSEVYQYIYIYLKDNKEILKLKDSCQFYHKIHKSKINLTYSRQIDSLFNLSDCIMRSNCEQILYKNDSIFLSKIPKEKQQFVVDTMNFNTLQVLIDKYGYPSEQKIGLKSTINAHFLLFNPITIIDSEKFLKMLKNALINGEIEPNSYAMFHDRLLIQQGLKPFFYIFKNLSDKLTIDEKIRVNERRKQYGIPLLDIE